MSRIQNYLSSEFLASGLSLEFNEFVTKITGAKSKTEESSHVHQELEKLVSKMGLPDVSSSKMKEYLIRLVHCYMLGYKVDFSMIYAIMASQSGETAMDRRVGYLACTLFLEEEHELSIMLINTLQRDLKSQHYLDRCAALNAICYIEHSEMLDNVLDLVIQCMTFPKQTVRKKAVFALYFLYKRTDLEFERIEPVLRNALDDKDTSVVFSSLSVWRMVLAEDVFRFKDMVPVFYRIHRQIIEKRIHASFGYHGVLAPWAQLECLTIYKLYQEANIGSPQELYSMVTDCLHSMEKKVDTAFAIVLECIKLLSAIDPILLASLSSLKDDEKYPFQQVLQPYLDASNHNLKYLGILAMSYVDQSVWDPHWLDGSLLSNVIRACFDDTTVIIQAIENLDKIMSKDVLKEAGPALIEALNRNHDMKPCNTTIAYWLLNRMTEYKTEPIDAWSLQTVMSILAETRKNLSDSYVQTQCDMLKQALIQETHESTLREASVHTAYQLLKRANSDILSPLLVQFAFWTIGQHGYLSTAYTDLDLMGQLQKWVLLVQDDYLQVSGLQAIEKCIQRNKTWLSSLESILKEFKKSTVPEKQQIAQDILILIQQASFHKEQDMNAVLNVSVLELSENPNRPMGIGKYYEENKSQKSTGKVFHAPLSYSRIIEESSTRTTKEATEEFGQRWLQYPMEHKLKFECSVVECEKLARRLRKSWRIEIIQLIGQEFIATTNSDVLIHVALLAHQQFELTLKAKQFKDISDFLFKRQLVE